MHRLTALDGMRGVAIGLVIAFHCFAFRQGWIGVDFFFVLSGYLITTILLREQSEANFWKMFYTRRVARLVPAFVALLAMVVLTERLSLVTWLYVVFTGSDLATVIHYDWMAAASLTMLWSLAIEAHFYMVWPLAIRRCSVRTLAIALGAIMMLEPIARVMAALHGCDWKVAYYLTPFRLDSLALGSLLAFGMADQRWRAKIAQANRYILPISMLAFAVSFPWLLHDQRVLFCDALGYSILAIVAASVLAHLILLPSSPVAKCLSFRPLVLLGRISYGLYLYHFFIPHLLMNAAARYGYVHNRRIEAASLLVSIPLAWLSFTFYERIFLEWGQRRVGAFREETAITANSGTIVAARTPQPH